MLEEIAKRLAFTLRRQWLLKGLRTASEAFWAAGIEEIDIDRRTQHVRAFHTLSAR